jgi:hypothetical protein
MGNKFYMFMATLEFQKMIWMMDFFLDNPLGKQINLVNRWQYANQKLVGFSFVNLDTWMMKTNGEIIFDKNETKEQPILGFRN